MPCPLLVPALLAREGSRRAGSCYLRAPRGCERESSTVAEACANDRPPQENIHRCRSPNTVSSDVSGRPVWFGAQDLASPLWPGEERGAVVR